MISVYTKHNTIFCRFRSLARKDDFNQLLECFKGEFPSCKWDWESQAWRLPMKDAPRLHWFASRYFGLDGIVYDDE